MTKIWHISDSHNMHWDYKVPENIDIVCHSGDCTNNFYTSKNKTEFLSFVEWYRSIDVPYKILVAGNHDAYIYNETKKARDILDKAGIIYLDKEAITINSLKFWGEPRTPEFGSWHFMADRSKMKKHWEQVPLDTNIIITHGPPKGILDLTSTVDHKLENAGCSNLRNHIENNVWRELKALCFGHIHANGYLNHPGVFTRHDIRFSNAAGAMDGQRMYQGLFHNGNILEF